ncbi:AAA family ATPase [Mesorhizobium yinganensis]|uniref:AAA family ATPase n=1 Tax=Mesorhizobium yinganensis TaxID=3157707 RepID=UPI0032B88204
MGAEDSNAIAARMIADADRDEEIYRNIDYDRPEASSGFRFVHAASLAGKPVPPREWVVEGLVPRYNVTLLGGDGGTGKSLLALQLAFAANTDGYWAGREVRPSRVIYWSAEDDLDELHRRLANISEATSVSLADVRNLHLLPRAGENSVLANLNPKNGAIVPTDLYEKLVRSVIPTMADIIILDSLADVYGADENIRTQVRQFVGLLRRLCTEQEVTVVVLAHPSLSGISTGTGLSGSTAWSNSVRSRLFLERVKADDGDEPDPDLRVLRVVKSNYAQLGDEIRLRWQAGTFVPATRQDSMSAMAVQSKAERIFLDLVDTYAAQGRYVSASPSANYAPTVFEKDPKAEGIRKRGFVDAMNRLFEAGKITIEETGPASRRLKRVAVVRDK